MTGALFLIIHGMLTVALVDYIKSLRLNKFLSKFSKIVLVFYILLIIVRVGIYIKLHTELKSVDVL
jgi:hypothetical protein